MNKGLRTFLIMLGLFVLVLGGCAYLLTQTGGNEAGDGGAGGGESSPMTFEEFQAINLNTNQGDIEADHGPPMAAPELEEAQITPSPGCKYYRSEDPQFGQFYEFCYENGILTVKSTL